MAITIPGKAMGIVTSKSIQSLPGMFFLATKYAALVQTNMMRKTAVPE